MMAQLQRTSPFFKNKYVKSVYHFWFGLSAWKPCFSSFPNNVSFAPQIGRHAAAAVNTVVPVVALIYLPLDFCFLGIIICLPMLTVVIAGIRADPQPPEQPADSEFFMVLVDEPVRL